MYYLNRSISFTLSKYIFSLQFSGSFFNFSVTIHITFQNNMRYSVAFIGAVAKKKITNCGRASARLSTRLHVSEPNSPGAFSLNCLFRIFIEICRQMPILFLLWHQKYALLMKTCLVLQYPSMIFISWLGQTVLSVRYAPRPKKRLL
jgi:hypothetical protein